MECLKCGGPVWDNRAKKASGEFSAKGPDFACKDKDGCGWVQWPPKNKGSGGLPATAAIPTPLTSPLVPASVSGQPSPVAAYSRGGSPKWTWITLADTYANCYAIAEQRLIDASKVGPRLGFTQADILAATATLFIAVSRDGVTSG